MKIYTKRGDDGSTGLFGGPRVSKADLRVAAYGDVDELNSLLGVVRSEFEPDGEFDATLARIQWELFNLGANLATPNENQAPRAVPAVTPEDIARLESEIDAFVAEVPPLKAFILPSGTRAATLLQLARTVCRRAERTSVALAAQETVPSGVLHYLNRLSDHLFTFSRAVNHRQGIEETKWLPRGEKQR